MREGFKINVHVKGIKNKCRKVDLHIFEIDDSLVSVPELTEEIKLKGLLFLKKNIKDNTYLTCDFHFQFVEIEEIGDGREIMRCLFFNPINKTYRVNVETNNVCEVKGF
ncbi:MAG: hypothetical protein H7836_04550 [Magnetococcus sp. YQC-3]